MDYSIFLALYTEFISLGVFALEENIDKLITPINAHYEDLTLPYTGLAAAKTLQRALSLA